MPDSELPAGAGPVDDEAVPAYWASLGLPGLVDLHVHFMPANVLTKVWAYFDAGGPLVGRPWPITYREAEDARLARLRALGVRAFPSLLYPHRADMAEWLNGWASSFAAAHPDVVHTGTFFPEPSADRYVAEALDGGARLFKAHVQVGGYDPRDPLLRPVWRRLAEAGVPVVVHCGSGPRPGAFTGPGPIGEVLTAAPGLLLVVAHLGMPEYAGFLDLAGRHERVHLDTTMAFTDFMESSMPFPPALRERLGELQDKVVLGSDFPNIPYLYAHQLQVLHALGLGEEWLRAVLHDNGARLLGLPPAGSPPAGT